MQPLTRKTYDFTGGQISAVHFGCMSNPLKLVFLHANGFNAQSYRTLLEPLAVHAVALDLRGHGLSTLPADPARLRNWHIFRDDIVAFFQRYVNRPVVLAGHSYGAVTGLLAGPALTDKITGYVGFDPVLIPHSIRMWAYMSGGRTMMKKYLPIARNAGRRKSVFASTEAAFERYKGRGVFSGFTDVALRDYLNGGLKPHPEGVQLACDPLWEQAIFVAQAHNAWRCLPHLPKNSQIIFAGKGPVSTQGSRAKVARLLARNHGGGQVDFKPDFAHLFPMQQTEFATARLRDALAIAALQG